MKSIFLIVGLIFYISFSNAQNIGIGTSSPQAMLHIQGNTDTSQLVIDANVTQSNLRPLIRLRNAAGQDLLHIHSDDSTNIFIGKGAGRMNTPSIFSSGRNNTFIGLAAGYANTTGYHNSAMGYRALFSNTTGGFNTANGSTALSNNTTGIHNSATGSEALRLNTTGSNNTAMGSESLVNNTTGNYNTATGNGALNLNTTGYDNTASGYRALYNNSTGYDNIAIGKEALYYNTTGYSNSAIGYQALFSNTSGLFNTASGESALYSNITGNVNTANGYNALKVNTGDANTAFGSTALALNSTGIRNTAIGYGALYTNTTGNYNTAIGYISDVTSPTFTNATALGYFTMVNASNKVRIGNTAVTVIEGAVAYSFPSDARFKYNINSNVPGLDFIKKLTPVTYYFDDQKFSEYTKTGLLNTSIAKIASNNTNIGSNNISKQLHTGFLAQDVEKITKEMGYEFDGVHAPTNEKDNYSIAYSQFIMPLVKSVQEQQQQIEDLKKENSVYKTELQDLKVRLSALEKLLNK